MRKSVAGLLSVLFVFGLASVSAAGMMDSLKGQAEGAKKEAQETMENTKAEASKSIEAKEATKKEGGSMMDQVKEGAKGKTEEAKQKTNEMIDNVGK